MSANHEHNLLWQRVDGVGADVHTLECALNPALFTKPADYAWGQLEQTFGKYEAENMDQPSTVQFTWTTKSIADRGDRNIRY